MIWTMRAQLEKIGSVGAVVAAAACPVCFPKPALLGALFGFGAFGAYESQFFVATQVMVVLALVGAALTYRRQRNRWLLASALASGTAVFAALYWIGSEWLAYVGLAGLVAASAPELWARIRRTAHRPKLESVITCPVCGARRMERMPADACQFFYDCASCGTVLRSKAGDCCVFCSYGSVKCPPMQSAGTT